MTNQGLAQIVAKQIPVVWDAIAADVGSTLEGSLPGHSIPAEDVVELCIDADRFQMFGNDDKGYAIEAYKKLLSKIQYDEFLKIVAAELPFKRYEI